MLDKLHSIFEDMQVDYCRQGSLTSVKDYPKEFFTYWQWQNDAAAHFDNKNNKEIAAFTICYYTSQPEKLYSRMEEFIAAALAAGFIVKGRGVDIASDSPDYPGRTLDVYFVKYS